MKIRIWTERNYIKISDVQVVEIDGIFVMVILTSVCVTAIICAALVG